MPIRTPSLTQGPRWQQLTLLALALLSPSIRGATIHVRTDGNDALPGTTWSDALRTVGRALALARAGDEVWVAQGTYEENLDMTAGVSLLGGFRGDELTSDQRDYVQRVTTLDGRTNDVVLVIQGGGPDTVLDGFTIRNSLGPGVIAYDTEAVVRHNVIRGGRYSARQALGGGILVANLASQVVARIEDNIIVDNQAQDGGGVACVDASPHIIRNVIAWNHAVRSGGGISCWRNSSPRITHNVIIANTTFDLGGYDLAGGGIFATADDLDGRPHPTATSQPLIANNVLAGNGAPVGGGLALVDSNGGVPVVLNNTIVANSGSGIYWASSSLPGVGLLPILRNNLVAYNPLGFELAAGTPTNAVIENNCVFANRYRDRDENYVGLSDPTGTHGNLAADPRFAQYPFGDFHLQPGSPCIDAGLTESVDTESVDTDGQPRVQGEGVDIGADESDGTSRPVVTPVWRVRADGDDLQDGRTWATAKKTVQGAIDQARYEGGEVWVAGGIYQEHIWIPALVSVYGGFAGRENRRDDRAIDANPTVLDGGGERHVVTSTHGGYRVSGLDGFTVRNAGQYTGGTGTKYGTGGLGGGFFVAASSPCLTRNIITRNSLAYDNTPVFPQPPSYGAGIYCESSYALIKDNTIFENEVLNDFDGSGGAIHCDRSWPTIEGNVIRDNRATYGAAIYCLHSAPIIRSNLIESNAMYDTYPFPLYLGSTHGAITVASPIDCLIEGNTIRGNTAAAGAGLTLLSARTGRVQNNLFVGNHAWSPTAGGGMGGAIHCLVITGGVDRVYLVNNTLLHNTATQLFAEQGGGVSIALVPSSDRVVVANNLIASNSSGIHLVPINPPATPLLSHNLLDNGAADYVGLDPGLTDIHGAPSFRDPAVADYSLQPASPGVDAGTSTNAPARDLRGVPRPLDGNNDNVSAPDIGAYETVHPDADSDADAMPDGWELAYGLDPTSRSDADTDPDRDGAANGAEYLAGTDPGQSTSVFRIDMLGLGENTWELSWPSNPDREYTVLGAHQVGATAVWESVAGPWPGAEGRMHYRFSSATPPASCFRIQLRMR